MHAFVTLLVIYGQIAKENAVILKIIKSEEKRVVHHLCSLRLLLQYHHLLVHHLHGVELGVVVTVVAEATEVDGADAAEDGRVGEVGGAMRLHEEALRGRGGGRDN